MKRVLILCLILTGCTSTAQEKHFNTTRGLFASGYDVTTYWDNAPIKGNKSYEYVYKDATFRFVSQANLERFKNNQKKYLPEYGGWCAYAIATSGDKVKVNPKRYEIRNGRLFIFYDFGWKNTLKSWREENPKILISKADENWKKIRKG